MRACKARYCPEMTASLLIICEIVHALSGGRGKELKESTRPGREKFLFLFREGKLADGVRVLVNILRPMLELVGVPGEAETPTCLAG